MCATLYTTVYTRARQYASFITNTGTFLKEIWILDNTSMPVEIVILLLLRLCCFQAQFGKLSLLKTLELHPMHFHLVFMCIVHSTQ